MQERKLTITENLNKPILKTLFKDNGKLCFDVVKILVKRFLNAFAFTTKLTADQIDILTADTIDHFSYESLEDIVLFFKMARSGKFGVTKRGIDSNLIFGEWFPQYMELKAETKEKIYTQQKEVFNSKLVKASFVSNVYKEAILRKQREKTERHIDHFIKDFDRQMLEDTIVSWQKDDDLREWVYYLKSKRRIFVERKNQPKTPNN